MPARATEPEAARIRRILMLLDERYGASTCSLRHDDPWQLLVATILSAQCTDARVNLVTPALFEAAPRPADLDAMPAPRLERMIKSTGFFRNKTKSLKGAARMLVAEMDGRVPAEMDALLRLPGVARKTANVVLGTGYGIASGVVVDTHVGRVSKRLGLTRHDDPKKVEQDLVRKVPTTHWIRFAHQIIDHGRAVCSARAPKCDACFLAPLCPFAAKVAKAAAKKRAPRATSKPPRRPPFRRV